MPVPGSGRFVSGAKRREGPEVQTFTKPHTFIEVVSRQYLHTPLLLIPTVQRLNRHYRVLI